MSLDEVDEKILNILRENSRTPFVEVARRIGLSEGSVRKRVDKLIKSGIIKKFTIEISKERAKFESALVLVKTDPSVSTEEIAKEISKITTARDVSEIAGQYDIALFLEEPTIEALNEKIERIRKVKGVLDTSSFIILKKHK